MWPLHRRWCALGWVQKCAGQNHGTQHPVLSVAPEGGGKGIGSVAPTGQVPGCELPACRQGCTWITWPADGGLERHVVGLGAFIGIAKKMVPARPASNPHYHLSHLRTFDKRLASDCLTESSCLPVT